MYAIFNDQSFNDLLTNDIISFERLGPNFLKKKKKQKKSTLSGAILTVRHNGQVLPSLSLL